MAGADGKPMWVPEADLDRLRSHAPPRSTRLLPPSDPWLQARDRDLVVPEEARRKTIWGAIGNPGVVLSDGEVVGTWRAKTQRKNLAVTVVPFDRPTVRTRKELVDEADRLALARGLNEAQLGFA